MSLIYILIINSTLGIIKLILIIDKRMKLMKLFPAFLIGFTTATEADGKSILEL